MDYLYDILKICLVIAGISFLLSGFVFFTIKIDESNIDKTRYCPSCGIDLINKFERGL